MTRPCSRTMMQSLLRTVETVRNHERGASRHQLIHTVLHNLFGAVSMELVASSRIRTGGSAMALFAMASRLALALA